MSTRALTFFKFFHKKVGQLQSHPEIAVSSLKTFQNCQNAQMSPEKTKSPSVENHRSRERNYSTEFYLTEVIEPVGVREMMCIRNYAQFFVVLSTYSVLKKKFITLTMFSKSQHTLKGNKI